MAVSEDGYTWTALNDDQPVISGDTIAMQQGIRDPHIFRGPDGAFYLAMTDLHIYAQREGKRDTEWERDGKKYGWGNNRGLVLMKSRDLTHWSRANIDFSLLPAQPDMNWKEVGCVWAPETVYDDERGQLMIHFTIREGAGKNRIYNFHYFLVIPPTTSSFSMLCSVFLTLALRDPKRQVTERLNERARFHDF